MTVAVVRGADTLLLRGYGQANRERGRAAGADVVYPIGSVTKQFTAAAIVQLAEQGRLSLDDDLAKHLPEFPTHGHRVTLRHLVDHSSGIREYGALPRLRRVDWRKATPDEMIALVAPEPLGFAPGAAMAYSNSGYLLLGRVVERVTGSTWAGYVRRNLLEPAGMRHSHPCGERADSSRATGYLRRARQVAVVPEPGYAWALGSGSLCSTAGDLVAWNRSLHEGTLLPPAAYREMTTPGALAGGAALRYAKGMVIDSAFGRRVFYHGGAIFGFRSELRYFPDDSLSIVVLANSTSADPQAVATAIARLIYGEEVDEAPLEPANWREYEGTYRGPLRYGNKAIVVRAGRGFLSVHTTRTNRARYAGNDTFVFGRERLTFLRTGGRITALRVDGTYSHAIMQRQK
jgi:CubicO group peptidase (beta-lactamase class C family)